jgi:hypothetical protein
MLRTVLTGIAAGAAGTTALNAVTYRDMAARARPASSTPDDTVRKAEELTGAALGGSEEEAANRRSALGALLGIASGLATGAAFDAFRRPGRRRPGSGELT